MDVSTITGLVLGSACVGFALVQGDSFAAYLDPAGLALVLGGAVAATLIATPLRQICRAHRVVLKIIRYRSVTPRDQAARLVRFSGLARQEGILALEGTLDEVDDPFLVHGVQLAIDGVEPEIIRSILETELESVSKRHEAGRTLFVRLGTYAMAFGLVGMLIGLVAMFSRMEAPSAIGPSLAAALLPVLYGVVVANLVFRPLADKLAAWTAEEVLVGSMAIQGVLAIQAGENPRHVDSKLRTFLSSRTRLTPASAA